MQATKQTQEQPQPQAHNMRQISLNPETAQKLVENAMMNGGDDKSLSNAEAMTKQRCRSALSKFWEILDQSRLSTKAGNFPKATYCYEMKSKKGDNINQKYFVKIYEFDPKKAVFRKPTLMAKKLFRDSALQTQLRKDLVIPAFQPIKAPFQDYRYEIVVYPYIAHINLEDLTIKAWKEGHINPEYFQAKHYSKPHSDGYRKAMLLIAEKTVNVVILLQKLGFVDMDISPDNFIIVCDQEGIANNHSIKFLDVASDACSKLMKIDHESTIKYKDTMSEVKQPMKPQFTAPEVNAKDPNTGKFKQFNVGKAGAYQIASTYIFCLYGQHKSLDRNGNIEWLTLTRIRDEKRKWVGEAWKKQNWNPKYMQNHDAFLQRAVHTDPSKRPDYKGILENIQTELKKLFELEKHKTSNFENPNRNGTIKVNKLYEEPNDANTPTKRAAHNTSHHRNGNQNDYNNRHARPIRAGAHHNNTRAGAHGRPRYQVHATRVNPNGMYGSKRTRNDASLNRQIPHNNRNNNNYNYNNNTPVTQQRQKAYPFGPINNGNNNNNNNDAYNEQNHMNYHPRNMNRRNQY